MSRFREEERADVGADVLGVGVWLLTTESCEQAGGRDPEVVTRLPVQLDYFPDTSSRLMPASVQTSLASRMSVAGSSSRMRSKAATSG